MTCLSYEKVKRKVKNMEVKMERMEEKMEEERLTWSRTCVEVKEVGALWNFDHMTQSLFTDRSWPGHSLRERSTFGTLD